MNQEVMRANALSALYGMQEVLPHFKARGAGHVLNVSSLLGRVPFAPIRSGPISGHRNAVGVDP